MNLGGVFYKKLANFWVFMSIGGMKLWIKNSAFISETCLTVFDFSAWIYHFENRVAIW